MDIIEYVLIKLIKISSKILYFIKIFKFDLKNISIMIWCSNNINCIINERLCSFLIMKLGICLILIFFNII